MDTLPPISKPLRVLFIGNSYTHTHGMPTLLEKLAASAGDVVLTSMRAPGGWALQQHYRDKATRAKIREGGWDYIVLQDQSQRPAMPMQRVWRQFYCYALRLNFFIWWYLSPKPTLIFYMTWGRRDGDEDNRSYYPPVGTFEGMSALLKARYEAISGMLGAAVAPVGEAWVYVRRHFPEIELYQADGHHPSLPGSYLAACCFYATLFGKSPESLTDDGGLAPDVAGALRQAALAVCFGNRA